jgi:adenylate cyclase
LKNVKKPLEVLAIASEGVAIPAEHEIRAGSHAAEISNAVLPFINTSAETENEYFSDGIWEELINVLSRVEGIRGTSRTSSFTYKGKQEDARNIGKQFNVRIPSGFAAL